MKQLMLITISVLLFTTTPAVAQELWGGARSGMTPGEVLKIFPSLSEQPPYPERPANTIFYRSQPVTIQQNPYVPQFTFVNGKLTRVALIYDGERQPYSSAHEFVFLPALAALRAKYGPELSVTNDAPGPVFGFKMEQDKRAWITKDRRIEMHMLEASGPNVATILHFTITYEPLATVDIDKF